MTRPGRAGGVASAARRTASVATSGETADLRGKPRRLRLTRRPPSPMIFTDELLADARRRYEQTAEAKGAISADLGIARSTFDHLVARLGWKRFTPPPRDVDAAAKLAAKAQAFAKALAANEGPKAAAAHQEATPGAAAPSAPPVPSAAAPLPPGETGDDMPMDTPALIAWLRREIQAQVILVKQLREQERAEPLTEQAVIRLSRILASLADALIKLDRHTGGASGAAGEPDDLPENIDEFRNELARRIRAFVASRTGTGNADGGGAHPSLEKAGG